MHQLQCVKSTELFIVSQTIQTLDMAEFDLQQENVNTVKSLIHKGLYWNNSSEQVFWLFIFHCDIERLFLQQ